MTEKKFSMTIHMVASVDGMVAARDNNISWFEASSPYEKGVTGENPETFLQSIDCYVMGAETYLHARALSADHGWAYGTTPTVVVTSRDLPVDLPNVTLHRGDLAKFVNETLRPRYKNVWLVGGPMLAAGFMRLGLADEIRLTVLPVILGDGLRFFEHLGQGRALQLKDVTAYKNGLVELRYAIGATPH